MTSTPRKDRTAAELTGGALELDHQAEHFQKALDGLAEWGPGPYLDGARAQLEQVIARLADDAAHLRVLAGIKTDQDTLPAPEGHGQDQDAPDDDALTAAVEAAARAYYGAQSLEAPGPPDVRDLFLAAWDQGRVRPDIAEKCRRNVRPLVAAALRTVRD